MMGKIMYATLVIYISFQISVGQTADFKFDNPFSSEASDFNSANSAPQAVETFIRTFNKAVYSSSILPEIFDLSQLPPEAFSKSVHDHAYASFVRVGHSDPETIAKVAGTPLGRGADVFTLPITVTIYANTAAKHLSLNGILNTENAVSLAMKYASFMEESAKRTWLKEKPDTKFRSIEDGFVGFLTSLELFNAEKVADVAFHYAIEVQNAGKSYV